MAKALHNKGPARFISQIRLLQMRVAAAEEALVRAKEAARRARRQRKLARVFFKRARKHAKEAKSTLIGARDALAQAELKAITAGTRMAVRVKAKRGGARILPRQRDRTRAPQQPVAQPTPEMVSPLHRPTLPNRAAL